MPQVLDYTTQLQDSSKTAFVEASGQLLRGLSPNRFSPADQEAEPSAQRTRLVKDVLTVGSWKVGYKADGTPNFWDVTLATLREIVANFNLQRSRGIRHNFCYGHGEADTLVVAPLNIIAPIDELVIVGNTLFASVYVTSFEALTLKRDGMYVSVRCLPTWEDGRARKYGRTLLHVAVVDEPAVDSQGRFLQMSNPPEKGKRKMTMSFDVVQSAVTALLPEGITMPEGLTEENFDELMPIFVQTLAQLGAATDEPATDTTDTSQDQAAGGDAGAVGDIPTDQLPANLANTPMGRYITSQNARTRRIESVLADLSNHIKSNTAAVAAGARVAYMNRLTALGMKGVPAAQLATLKKTGELTKWDLNNLVPFEQVAGTVDLSNKGQTTATPAAPTIGGKPARTAERTAELRKFAGLKPLETK